MWQASELDNSPPGPEAEREHEGLRDAFGRTLEEAQLADHLELHHRLVRIEAPLAWAARFSDRWTFPAACLLQALATLLYWHFALRPLALDEMEVAGRILRALVLGAPALYVVPNSVVWLVARKVARYRTARFGMPGKAVREILEAAGGRWSFLKSKDGGVLPNRTGRVDPSTPPIPPAPRIWRKATAASAPPPPGNRVGRAGPDAATARIRPRGRRLMP